MNVTHMFLAIERSGASIRSNATQLFQLASGENDLATDRAGADDGDGDGDGNGDGDGDGDGDRGDGKGVASAEQGVETMAATARLVPVKGELDKASWTLN